MTDLILLAATTANTTAAQSPELKLGPDASIYDHLELVIFGFGWVMITLMILSMGIVVVSKLVASDKPTAKSAPAAAPAAAPAPTASGASDSHGKIPAHHLAAIAAAVFTTLGSASRVVSIRTAAHGWAQEGRRQHFQSHRVR